MFFSSKKNKFEGGLWHIKKAVFLLCTVGSKTSMETKMMKKTMNLLCKWALGVCLLFVGAQNAFALKCEGTIHVKLPKGWSAANIVVDGAFLPITPAADGGWTELDATKFGSQYADNFLFVGGADWNSPGISRVAYDINGWDQADKFTCADFGAGTNVYIYDNPASAGKTVISTDPPDAKYFFVMIPPEMDEWMSSVPMLSMDGGQTGKPMKAVDGMCGWYSYVFYNETITDNVVLFRDDDAAREDMIGVNGNWETSATAQPIALHMIFNMGVDSLFFVPDEEQKTNADGYYYSAAEVDGIEGNCTYTMAAIIYDTDASLHPAFSCWSQGGEGCQAITGTAAQGVSKEAAITAINACIGVTPGVVEPTLDESVPQSMRKPKLTTAGKKCFMDEKYFNQLFNYTEGVNEKSCYDMPFSRASDGKWEFDSDFYVSAGVKVPGGFYPVEITNDSIIKAADPNQKPVAAARTKRTAEGAIFYGPALRAIDPNEGMPVIDLFCNGSGWNGGYDCTGVFGDGEETTTYIQKSLKLASGACVIGWSCQDSPPKGWTFYKENSEIVDSAATLAANGNPRWKADRNQHYCFESHAKFTYKSGLKFNFRGDDDIWVFIDNQLAVDLGGTHLAAPGYVNLDNFKGKSGALVAGNQYDLDIFFCDRRTTMSNVRIKTNMYIQQKTDIDVKGSKNKDNMSETTYNICYTKSGDGSCAAAMTGDDKEETYCGDQITNAGLNLSYTLVQGNLITSPAVPGVENVSSGIHKCGIDLTNPTAPKINKEAMCLGGGRYTLFVNIDGRSKKVATFRMSGEVDVIYKNGVALDTTGKEIPGGKYTLQTTAMAGQLVPVYVSSVAPKADGSAVEIFPEDAKGVDYTLAYDRVMKVYVKEVDALTGTESYVKLASGAARKIGDSGVDTVYVTVDMDDMTEAIHTYSVSVSGKLQNALNISFYLPQITFIEKIPGEGETAKSVKGQAAEADGSYEEKWVGTLYDMYLAVLKPNADGKTYSPCLEECDGLEIHKGAGTSPKIDFTPATVKFKDGYATIQVRSLTKYRWDESEALRSPATIVAEYNDYVQAVYNPIYFRDPPVPYPVLADVFDVHGSTPSVEYKIPAPYFDMDKEYLDGIGDSVTIYYDRAFHKDSLPTKICLMWDSASAEAHNPYAEGYSNIPKDTSVTCNALLNVDKSNVDCSSPDAAGYCTRVVTLGGFTLSHAAKTSGVGKVHSYAIFEDKGKVVKQGFAGALTDRIAPVPLRAEVRTIKEGDEMSKFDSLVVIMSEPVKILTTSNGRNSVDFYLNSAVDLSEGARYASALGGTEVLSTKEPGVSISETGEGRIKFLYTRGDVSPHVGDYLRLGGDLTNIFWSDTTDLTLSGGDTLRSTADATYAWNSPTSYSETKRLPSPWIPVIGDANKAVHENKFASTANAPAGEKVPVVTVHSYRTTMTKAEVFAEEGGKPGHFIEADMYALYNGLPDSIRGDVKVEDIYFYYEVQYYTNLGNFVASKSQKIYCDDKMNTDKDPLTNETIQYFNGGTCIEAGNDRNYFIGWNMRSDKGRVVGTGAYIVKLNSYVKLGDAGKDAKQESTSVWGIKRSPKPVMDYLKGIGQ